MRNLTMKGRVSSDRTSMFCNMYPKNLHNPEAVEITRESDKITTRKTRLIPTMITTHIKPRDKGITIITAKTSSMEVNMKTGITRMPMMTSHTPQQLLNLRVRTAEEGTSNLLPISKADNNIKPEVWILINRMTTMSKRAIPIREPDLHLEVEAVVEQETRTMVGTSMVLVSLWIFRRLEQELEVAEEVGAKRCLPTVTTLING